MTQFLSQDEVESLVMAVIRGQGDATEDEMQRAVEWANEARIDNALITLVLEGTVLVNARDNPDDLMFKRAPADD